MAASEMSSKIAVNKDANVASEMKRQPGADLGNIPQYMKKLFDDFDQIRDKNVKDVPKLLFWDMVVLTTADAAQKVAYEQQIEAKLKRKEIPSGLPYHVFSDPPGPKAGCGVSTMFVISELTRMYGETEFQKMRILLINAGGQSQRLPSASILGKIFTALPVREPPYQVLELKLASYMSMLPRMKPGIFHAASDTIEVFDMDDTGDWTFEREGFTALAHPSTLDIGKTHGVFILKDKPSDGESHLAEIRTCLEVLQKPSVERMEEKGAVQGSDTDKFVYTDSVFFFDHGVSRKLLDFYRQNEPILCEIDGYGDFLQALGPRSSIDYTRDTRNVSKVEPTLIETRAKIYHLLKDTPLNIVCLNASCFYHLGTVMEYIDNYTNCQDLRAQVGMEKCVFSVLEEEDAPPTAKRSKLVPSNYCLIHSYFARGSSIGDNCVVEYCDFRSQVTISSACVVSSCTVKESEKVFYVPQNLFLHTVSITTGEGDVMFATIVFNIKDNFKKRVKKRDVGSLTYMGMPLDDFLKINGRNTTSIFPKLEENDLVSLWDAKLFPAYDTMSESFEAAIGTAQCDKENVTDTDGKVFVSMLDILTLKNAAKMLEFRQNLNEKLLKLR